MFDLPDFRSFFTQWIRPKNHPLSALNFFISLAFSATAAGIVVLLMGFSLLPIAIAASVGFLGSLLFIHRPGAYFDTNPIAVRIGMPILMLAATFGSIGLLPFAGVAVPLLPVFFAGLPAVAIGFVGAGVGVAAVLVFGVVLPLVFNAASFKDQLVDPLIRAIDVSAENLPALVAANFGYDSPQIAQSEVWVNIGGNRYVKWCFCLMSPDTPGRSSPQIGRPKSGYIVMMADFERCRGVEARPAPTVSPERRRAIAADRAVVREQDAEFAQAQLDEGLKRSAREAEAKKDKRPAAWRETDPTPAQLKYLIYPLTQLCEILEQHCPRSIFSGTDQIFVNLHTELNKFAGLPENTTPQKINALFARFNTWYLETSAPAPESSVELETVKRLASEVLACSKLQEHSEEQIDDLNAQAISVRDQRLDQIPWSGDNIQYIETKDELDKLLGGENAEWVKRNTWYIAGCTNRAGNLPLYRHMLATPTDDSIPVRDLPRQRYMIGEQTQLKTATLITQLRAAEILPQLESAPDSDNATQSAMSTSFTPPLSSPAPLPPTGNPQTPADPPNPSDSSTPR